MKMHRLRHASLPIVAAALAALLGCAAAPPVRLGPDADPKAARDLLADAAAEGPVRLELNRSPDTLPRGAVEEAAAAGVRGLAVRFAAAAPAVAGRPARLLLLFDPPPDPAAATGICAAAGLPAAVAQGPGTRLRAVFCDGGAYVADASGAADGRDPARVRRLVWRTTARLFPDDYEESYGFDLFGLRVGLSGSFGF